MRSGRTLPTASEPDRGGELRRAALSLRPSMVAWAAVILSAAAASLFVVGGVEGLFGAGLALLMGSIAIIDARRFIIPDELSAAAGALGLLQAAVQGGLSDVAAAGLRALVLAAAFWVLRLGYHWWRGRHGLGLGDVKLAGVAGLWLGVMAMPVAVELAALSGIVGYVLRRRWLGLSMRVTGRLPFGAFFAPAIWCAWMLQALVPVLA